MATLNRLTAETIVEAIHMHVPSTIRGCSNSLGAAAGQRGDAAVEAGTPGGRNPPA